MLGALGRRLGARAAMPGVGRGLAGVGLGALVGDARRAGLHRLDRVDGDRQRLVLDLDQVERLVGDRQVVGRDGGHRLAGEDDAIDRQHGVGARLGARLQLRDVGGGQHGAHARQRPRLAGVDALDAGVGVRAAQQPGLQQPGQLQVGRRTGSRPVTFSGESKRGMRQPDAAHVAAWSS